MYPIVYYSAIKKKWIFIIFFWKMVGTVEYYIKQNKSDLERHHHIFPLLCRILILKDMEVILIAGRGMQHG
jgi:hypothetical protein